MGDTPPQSTLDFLAQPAEILCMSTSPSTDSIAKALARSLSDSKAPLDVGAMATGLGLLGNPLAGESLQKKLKRTTEAQALAHVAVGGGLLKLRETIPALHKWISSTTYRIQLTQELAIALALLEDRSLAPMLMQRLHNAKSLTAQAALAQAIGRVGDVSSLQSLLELYQNDQVSASARAFAAVALGIVADQQDLPWNTILKVNFNYFASTDTLYNQKGTGVLNIL